MVLEGNEKGKARRILIHRNVHKQDLLYKSFWEKGILEIDTLQL